MTVNKPFRIVQYMFAIIVAFCTLAPYSWLFISSISYQKNLTKVPLSWIPSEITFHRYYEIFFDSGNAVAYTFRISLVNSIIIASVVTVIGLIIGGLAAYALAKLKFKFQKSLIYMLLFTYMVPPIVIVIPLYLILNKAGMLDSKLTLILIYLTFVIPFVIWIMQSYLSSISKDFEEAASIDGCSRLQSLWYVVLPLVLPGLIATGILSFLLSWEEFLYSLLFTSSLDAKTISVAISEFSGKNAVDYGMVSTGGIIASLPPVIIAFIFQRYLVQGMLAGGVKE